MRTSLAPAAVVAAIVAAAPAFAQDRRQALDTVDRALATPEAARAASSVGVDIAAVRAAVPALSDAELADISARATALESDPVAGLDHDIKLLLEIFLIVAI